MCDTGIPALPFDPPTQSDASKINYKCVRVCVTMHVNLNEDE